MKLLLSKFLLLTGLWGMVSWQAREAPRPYNIIYISVEDMWPSLGCYGDTLAHSPNLDQFARESVLFEDVHCQVSLCTPSRTSLLTGIRPSSSGIVKIDDDWQSILPGVTSLPRHFRNHGYYTALAGKIHDPRSGGSDSAYSKVYEEHGVNTNLMPLQALEDLTRQNQPFFLAIGYSQAHDPWTPAQSAKDKYTTNQFSAAGRASVYSGQVHSAEGIRELVRNYYGEVTEVDSLIGEVVQKIKALGLYENSLILVGAFDHGYNLGYRNRWGKGNCYDNETRVPMLVRVPGNPQNGRRSPALVELVDMYPTLVDLCRLPSPSQQLEGLSFRPLLENPGRSWKKAVINHRAYAVDIVGVKTRQYNLIDFAGDSVQLFDRIRDPINLVNIAGSRPEVVRKMKRIKAKGWEGAIPR
ncbi:sulfatase-like hydrolase/transferase [Persicitalea jodogahamensis]|uniref:Sulfatase N-terminal domain-containing protein n=1 Tax=Persicitalea jodogahamensis TaxID=402147 RepID=A0A8J3DDC1_9BACT|nr:sulfatase-like hydrolase/transferase [Persicitalea jodogahamensis]GHB86543.1 hypothetical protein GCM10007390_47660 [Persicitalea jodogahamensis]